MRNMAQLFMMLALCLVWAGNTAGGQGEAPAPSQKKHSSFEYNPTTVVSLEGIITAISPAESSSLPEPVFLTMDTDQGKIQVFLGPNWYVEEQGLSLAVLDRVEVTGSRILEKGKIILFARKIKKGGQSLELRNDQGIPLWGGKKQRQDKEKSD